MTVDQQAADDDSPVGGVPITFPRESSKSTFVV